VPAKNLFKIYALGFGIAVVAVVVAVIVIMQSGSTETVQKLPSRGDLVRVQVRSFPAMKRLLMNGKEMGKTPKMLLVPRGQPIDLEVWFDQDPQAKHVVPTDDMYLDFRPAQKE
jgi:hypothetical protein